MTPKDETMSDSTKERESYGSGKSTTYGYQAEWRLKPESAILQDAMDFNGVQAEWRQAPYSKSQLGLLEAAATEKLVRPYISRHDEWRHGNHQLVNRAVAIAIIACMKTSIKEALLKHIEWRIIRIRLESSYSLTRDDDGNVEHEEFMDKVVEALGVPDQGTP